MPATDTARAPKLLRKQGLYEGIKSLAERNRTQQLDSATSKYANLRLTRPQRPRPKIGEFESNADYRKRLDNLESKYQKDMANWKSKLTQAKAEVTRLAKASSSSQSALLTTPTELFSISPIAETVVPNPARLKLPLFDRKNMTFALEVPILSDWPRFERLQFDDVTVVAAFRSIGPSSLSFHCADLNTAKAFKDSWNRRQLTIKYNFRIVLQTMEYPSKEWLEYRELDATVSSVASGVGELLALSIDTLVNGRPTGNHDIGYFREYVTKYRQTTTDAVRCDFDMHINSIWILDADGEHVAGVTVRKSDRISRFVLPNLSSTDMDSPYPYGWPLYVDSN